MLVPRNVFAVAKCADTSDGRYALSGVRFERDAKGKPVAVATDGKRMLAVQWTEAKPSDFPANVGDTHHVADFATILPAKACDAARKGLGLKITKHLLGIKPVLENVLIEEPAVNGVVPMATTNIHETQRSQPESLEGRFPLWRDVLNRTAEHPDGCLSICVDPRALAGMLLAMADAATTEDHQGVILTIDASDEVDNEGWRKSLTVSHENENGTKAVGLIMPMVVGRRHENNAPQPVRLPVK